MQSILGGGKGKRDWGQWRQGRILGKWFRRDNLIILALSGILLLIIAIPIEKKEKGAGSESGKDIWERTAPSGTAAEDGAELEKDGESAGEMTDGQYAAWLEERLTAALSRVEGIGEVQVMITLSSSRELVVERDTIGSRSATNEVDAQGGSRLVSQEQTQETVVCRSEGTASEPYVIKTLPPEVEGVLVVAEGAGTGTVNRTVTAAAQALFGIDAHKVSVVRMGSK